MPDPSVVHHVFVDFENVQDVDLDLIDGLPVAVTLVIGKSQTRLETSLVTQIHRHAVKVSLIEAGASGRNALDLILAHYLGRTLATMANSSFHIVSKDKDFDPLIAHLILGGVTIARSASFSGLPFLVQKKVPPPPRKPASPKARTAAVSAPPAGEVRLEKLIAQLLSKAGPRPKKKDKLLHYIETVFGKELAAGGGSDKILSMLIARGIVEVALDEKLTYPHQAAGSHPKVSVPPETPDRQ